MTAETTRGAQGSPAAGSAGRTGIYFCRCGPNLGQLLRLGELEQRAGWPSASDVATHDVLCSPEGQAWLARRIREQRLERVVIGACSPREHEETFRRVLASEGRSPYQLQLVNLREQVEWLGGDPGAATERARRLVRAALARIAFHRPIPLEEVEVSPDVLVVGGGAAGLSAARVLAGKGRKVIVVERAFALGGLANQLDEVFPGGECASCFMEPVLDEVLHHDRIEVLTGAEVRRVRGGAGRFTIELALRARGVDAATCLGCPACTEACPAERDDPFAGGLTRAKAIGLPYAGCMPHVAALDAASCLRSRGVACDACVRACPFGAIRLDAAPAARVVTVGAIVVATGLSPGAVEGPDGVVTSYQLERMLHPNGPTRGAVRGAAGTAPRSVLLAAAADGDGDLPALEILKLARLVKARLPGTTVAVAGGLDRVPHLRGRRRELEGAGIELLRGELPPDAVARAGDRLTVRIVADGAETVRAADLVVVHAPAVPAPGAAALAAALRITTGERGFLVDRGAGPFEPTATRVAGIHVAGAAAGPRTIAQAVRDGAAAAGLVLASLVPGERRLLEPLAAEVDDALCGSCGICASVCPFGAVVILPAPGKARVERAHCRGCGTCAAACPTGAASAPHFTGAQIEAELSALLGPLAAGG